MSSEVIGRWADEELDGDEPELPQVSAKISIASQSRRTSKPKPTGLSVVVRHLEGETISSASLLRYFPEAVSIKVNPLKGMAFVELRTRSQMDRALALDGTKSGKRVVSVSVDVPRKEYARAPGIVRPDPGVEEKTDARWAFTSEKKEKWTKKAKEDEQVEVNAEEARETVRETAEEALDNSTQPQLLEPVVTEKPSERKKLVLAPRAADLPPPLPPVKSDETNKAIARMLRKKEQQTVGGRQARPRGNRFAAFDDEEDQEHDS